MQFANLQAAYWFWLIPGLIFFYLLSWRKREKEMGKFAQKKVLQELTGSLNLKRRKLKFLLLNLAIFFCIFALLGPQWGFHWEKVKRKGLDILIAIDTSKSMLSEDVKPNRLERSKLAVEDLVGKLQGDRIGLIAFSGKAFLQCPLTIDYSGFLLSLNALDINTIPQGGTSISSAIREAIKSYPENDKKYRILVLITDGENHIGNPIQAASEARKQGIKIFSIGIGTKEGELIPLTDKSGNKTFLKDRQGNFVKSRLDETTLQKIALTTGGGYVKATATEFGLDLIYAEKLCKMNKREIKAKMRKRYEERFQIPLFFALLFLLLEPLISEKDHSKKRWQ